MTLPPSFGCHSSYFSFVARGGQPEPAAARRARVVPAAVVPSSSSTSNSSSSTAAGPSGGASGGAKPSDKQAGKASTLSASSPLRGTNGRLAELLFRIEAAEKRAEQLLAQRMRTPQSRVREWYVKCVCVRLSAERYNYYAVRERCRRAIRKDEVEHGLRSFCIGSISIHP